MFDAAVNLNSVFAACQRWRSLAKGFGVLTKLINDYVTCCKAPAVQHGFCGVLRIPLLLKWTRWGQDLSPMDIFKEVCIYMI